MAKQVSTTMLEVFHAIKIGYLPKRTCFSIDKMIAGTQIATLDHNHNVARDPVSITKILFEFVRIKVNNIQNTEKIHYFLQFSYWQVTGYAQISSNLITHGNACLRSLNNLEIIIFLLLIFELLRINFLERA